MKRCWLLTGLFLLLETSRVVAADAPKATKPLAKVDWLNQKTTSNRKALCMCATGPFVENQVKDGQELRLTTWAETGPDGRIHLGLAGPVADPTQQNRLFVHLQMCVVKVLVQDPQPDTLARATATLRTLFLITEGADSQGPEYQFDDQHRLVPVAAKR